MQPTVWLLAAHALHLGFQLTVTLVVYPALAATPEERWAPVHHAHGSRIGPVVALVYGALATACVVSLLGLLGVGSFRVAPGVAGVGGTVAALTGAAGAAAATGLGAARTHGRLAGGYDPARVRRLLREDRVRCGFAVLGAIGAVVAAVAVAA